MAYGERREQPQRASLEAEAERQSVALGAGAERHEATLRHERGLADRAELRTLLDGLMGHIAVADREEVRFESARYAYESEQGHEMKARAGAEGEAAGRAFTDAFFALEHYRNRLRARLGGKHELAGAFGTLLDAIGSASQVMHKVTWPPSAEHEKWIAETKWAYFGRRDEFVETAARFIGTQVSEP